jgi:rare lipoprotein A
MNIHSYFWLSIFFSLAMQEVSAQEKGYAINYKESDASRITSSSELYDPNKFTAAHNTLPIGTLIQVTRIDNGASVTVRINDRGPFIPNRILALSKAAAIKLGLKKYEKVYVQLSMVPIVEPQAVKEKPVDKKSEIPFYQPGSTLMPPANEGKEPITLSLNPGGITDTLSRQEPEKKELSKMQQVPLKAGIYQLHLNKISRKGFAVQIGSFQNTTLLWNEITRLHNAWFQQILLESAISDNGQSVYKLLLGPFPSREKANSYKNNLKEKYGIDGFIVSPRE